MKKMLVIIIILAIIFVAMLINRNTKKQENVNIQEIQNIEEYIGKIYMWKEVTKEAMPEFADINETPEQWVWEVVKKDIEEYEVTYEQIEQKARELFGDEFTKKFPEEGTEEYVYDKETQTYLATEINLDAEEDNFLLLNIEKQSNNYVVEIAEYVVDYSNEKIVKIKNLEGKEIRAIGENDSQDTIKIKELVKENIDRFSKKRIYIMKKENLQVTKVEKID